MKENERGWESKERGKSVSERDIEREPEKQDERKEK